MTAIALVLLTLLHSYYFQKRRVIKSKVKGIGINKDFYEKVQNRKALLEKLAEQLTFKVYFNELFKLKELMASAFFKTKSTSYAYSKWKNIFDVMICTSLVLMGPIYYTFILVPPEIQTYTLFGINIGSHGFQDVNIFVWNVCLKICIIIPSAYGLLRVDNGGAMRYYRP